MSVKHQTALGEGPDDLLLSANYVTLGALPRMRLREMP